MEQTFGLAGVAKFCMHSIGFHLDSLVWLFRRLPLGTAEEKELNGFDAVVVVWSHPPPPLSHNSPLTATLPTPHLPSLPPSFPPSLTTTPMSIVSLLTQPIILVNFVGKTLRSALC